MDGRVILGQSSKTAGWHTVELNALASMSEANPASLEIAAWPDGLQYLDYEDATKCLSAVHTLLKPGGVLIASMPDLSKICKVALDDKINIDIRVDVIRCLYTPPHSIVESVKFMCTPTLFIDILNKIGFGFCHQVARPNQLIKMFGGEHTLASKFRLKSHMYFFIIAEKLI
jgi:hypothetical protein